MGQKSWKEVLLSTGLPLEYSVRGIIHALDLTTAQEFGYIRQNEQGHAVEFSVDVLASQIGGAEPTPFRVDYLIECKYRREGTKWIFIPERPENSTRPSVGDLFVTLDQLTQGARVDRQQLQSLTSRYRLAAKGCEVIDSDKDTHSIEQAVHQLRYAMPNRILEALRHHVDHAPGLSNPVWTILLIVVTTAELWCLREGTTIADIKASSDLSNVADKHNHIILFRPPDNLLDGYTRQTLQNGFDQRQRIALDQAMREAGHDGWPAFISRCSRCWPSHFLVVHLDCFEKLMAELTAQLKNVTCYTRATV